MKCSSMDGISKRCEMEKKRYTMIYDTDSFCDGIEYDSFEAAMCDAEDTLCNWQADQMVSGKYSEDPREWTEKQIDDWDYMIYNCSTYVLDNETGEETYPEYPTSWVTHDELIKMMHEREGE